MKLTPVPAKAEVTEVRVLARAEPAKVILELTPHEAGVLRALVARCNGGSDTEAWSVMGPLYRTLSACHLVPEYTFRDLPTINLYEQGALSK